MSIREMNSRLDRIMGRRGDPRRPPFVGCQIMDAEGYAAYQEAERQRIAIEGEPDRGVPVFTGMILVTSGKRPDNVHYYEFRKGDDSD